MTDITHDGAADNGAPGGGPGVPSALPPPASAGAAESRPAPQTRLRALVVDDEPIARRRLRGMLAQHPDVDVVGECDDGTAALRQIAAVDPDVIFLDVRMPEIDGFALLDALPRTRRPFVVFVTAYAEHAVQAFDAEAVDYLLKPYDRARLAKAVDRARAAVGAIRSGELRIEVRALMETMRSLMEDKATAGAPPGSEGATAVPAAPAPQPPRYLDRVAVTIGRRTLFIPAPSIDWIGADRNYVQLHVSGRTYLLRSTISSLEERLDPHVFIRVHRSVIVRVDAVRELRMVSPGSFRAVLADGTEVPVSAAYRDRLPRP